MNAPATNEFAIRFANVNGSGSASANQLFAKALFRMGLPVSVKNIFPSNIQGAPTWYEVRASEAGHLARKSYPDMVVAMNPQTYAQDVALLQPGGVLFYDSSFERDFGRDDIRVEGAPFMQMCLETFGNVKPRHMFKNIAYCGAIGTMLGIPLEVFENLLGEVYAGKEKLIAPNVQALKLGANWVLDHRSAPLPFAVKACDNSAERIMMTGNDSAGLGCVYGGATVAAWYPITPSTSLAEAFANYSSKYRTGSDGKMRAAIVQAEDELAAAGMTIGAGWNGARAFTATSGPGVSLMSEFLGLAYLAEVPMVLFNVQRGGPSTGMPTRTQQSDILACAYASHGDTMHPLLFPSDPKECFEMAAYSFDLADRLQTPVMVMSDLDLGMNEWVCDPLEWDDKRKWDRGKLMTAKMLDNQPDWKRYLDVDGDGIPWRTLPGTHPEKGAYLARGTSHNEAGGYTEDGNVHADILRRITRKWETAKTLVPAPEYSSEKPEHPVALAYFGTTSAAVPETMEMLARQGISLDLVRLRAFPFSQQLLEWLDGHDTVLVAEQNRDGQMRKLLIAEGGLSAKKLLSVCLFDGLPVTAVDLYNGIDEHLATGPRALATGS